MTTPDTTPSAAAPATTTPPAAAPAPTPAADPGPAPVPYARFQEVNSAKAAAEARAAAAEARAAELERRAGRLELRADLGIDDDDDADRVLSAYEKAHAQTDASKRPKPRDWVRGEGVLDTLPKSIRTAYGAAWAQAAGQTPASGQAQGQPAARQPAAGAPPTTARGAAPAPTGRGPEAPMRRTPRRPV